MAKEKVDLGKPLSKIKATNQKIAEEIQTEKDKKVEAGEKLASISESEVLQKQGFVVVAIFEKDGTTFHKLIKEV